MDTDKEIIKVLDAMTRIQEKMLKNNEGIIKLLESHTTRIAYLEKKIWELSVGV